MTDKNTNRISDEMFAEVYNDLVSYPTMRDVANALDRSYQTVKNRAALLRRKLQADSSGKYPKLAIRSAAHIDRMLMSEESIPGKAEVSEVFTPEECVDELRRIAEADPERVVTRNHFRIHSRLRESHWNCHFGTFQEFKRQSRLILTRGQHNLERKVGIHASRDTYRRIGQERMDREKTYSRSVKDRWRTILVGSDLHDIECDPFWLRVFIDTAKRIQPDIICLNGDVFDLPEFGRYNVDPRTWDVVGRIRYVHREILAPLREACPGSQIDMIEGNHERRLLLHLSDATPALKAVLGDLHGWDVAKLFGLDEFEVNYHAKGDLAALSKSDMRRELEKSYKNYWDIFIAHHFPHGRNMGLPGWSGHHHRHQIWESYNPIFGTYEWHQLGAGHRRDAEYCEGERWSNGFLIANCDAATKSTCMDYVQITDFSVAAGKFYYRSEEEGGGNLAVWPGK